MKTSKEIPKSVFQIGWHITWHITYCFVHGLIVENQNLNSGCPLSGLKPVNLILCMKEKSFVRQLLILKKSYVWAFSVFLLTPAEVKFPFEIRTAIEIYLKHDTWADMSFSRLYHDPLLHVFLGFMICMHSFFFFGFVSWHNPLCAGCCFSYPSRFVCLFPDFGWMHFLCVSVLSLPVQCWSLSYGKQRRPFRLYAPTWLRQQVWRPFYFFCTWSLFFFFCYSLLSPFLVSCVWVMLNIFPG